MSKQKNSTTKKTDSAIDLLKLEQKSQLTALKKAKNIERSQFGMFNRLKQLDRDFEAFNLNPFQRAICENINIYFMPLTTLYSKGMKRKAEQVERLKNGKTPLMNETYVLKYENNGYEFSKNFNTEKKANEAKKALSVKNITIEKKLSPVKTGFSENEAIRLLHKAESKFIESFPTAEVITLPMLKRALSLEVPKKEQNKKAVEKTKISLKKAS